MNIECCFKVPPLSLEFRYAVLNPVLKVTKESKKCWIRPWLIITFDKYTAVQKPKDEVEVIHNSVTIVSPAQTYFLFFFQWLSLNGHHVLKNKKDFFNVVYIFMFEKSNGRYIVDLFF